MADKELKTIKFQMMLSESEAEAIDDWSFKNRIRSRAEAIRRLCQVGIALEEKADQILKLTNEIIARRVKDGQKLEIIFEATKVDPVSLHSMSTEGIRNALHALEDHTRLHIALVGLMGPVAAMKDAKNLEEALALAAKAKESLEEIVADAEAAEKESD